VSSLKIEDLAETLNPLRVKYEVVLYGSQVEGGVRPDSDIDIGVITRETNIETNIETQKELLGIFPLNFDVRVFELFPIYIQISIIETYQVIFGDILEISEYFYSFRKKWDDCKHRILSNQFSSYRERLNLIK
jgi:predicted nucleotidyltransferase